MYFIPIDVWDNSVRHHFKRKSTAYLFARQGRWHGYTQSVILNQFRFVFLIFAGPSSGLTGVHIKLTRLTQTGFPFNLCQHRENENPCLRSRTHLHCQAFCRWNEKGGVGQVGSTARSTWIQPGNTEAGYRWCQNEPGIKKFHFITRKTVNIQQVSMRFMLKLQRNSYGWLHFQPKHGKQIYQ